MNFDLLFDYHHYCHILFLTSVSITGDRKYRIPNLNPLTLYNFQVDSGSRAVGIKLVFKEAFISGLAEAEIKATRFDLDKKHVEFDLLFRKFYITGDYDISGRVLVLPIQGKGPANITLSKFLFLLLLVISPMENIF